MSTQRATESPAVPLWLGGAAALAMIVHLYLVFVWVSTESTMGIIQRIFYFHVPAAMTAFVACFVGGVASILYLATRDNKWDAKLTSAFLLFFLYVAYLLIRRATPVEVRATVCAVICILGMLDVPLIYLSNRIFRTQHPSPVIGGGRGSGLERAADDLVRRTNEIVDQGI